MAQQLLHDSEADANARRRARFDERIGGSDEPTGAEKAQTDSKAAADKKKNEPGLLSKAASVAVEAGKATVGGFQAGGKKIADALVPPVEGSEGGVASRVGEAGLGVLEAAMAALGVSAGSAAGKTLAETIAGQDQKAPLPEGLKAAYAMASKIFSLPQRLLDPHTTAEQWAEQDRRDENPTWGDLGALAGSFAAPVAGKLVGKAKGKAAEAPKPKPNAAKFEQATGEATPAGGEPPVPKAPDFTKATPAQMEAYSKANNARVEWESAQRKKAQQAAKAAAPAPEPAAEPASKAVVEGAGGKFLGEDKSGVWFNEPETGSTMLFTPDMELSPDALTKAMADKRAEFAAASNGNGAAPEMVDSAGHPYEKTLEPLADHDVAMAREYDAAETDPEAKGAWDALASDTEKKYEEIAQKVQIEKVTGQPYASADEMNADIANGRFKVTTDNSDHPFWNEDQNWKFRVVHDYLGHFETGNDFSLPGETNAYHDHAAGVTDPLARKALQMEVYGQAAANVANGDFQPQKAYLTQQPEPPKARLTSKNLHKQTLKNGGATFDPRTGRLDEGTTGYAVSNTKGGSMDTPLADFGAGNIDEFARLHADELAQPDAYHGTWVNGDSVVQDVSRVVPDQEQAMRLGVEGKQKAIWDRAKGEEIPTDQPSYENVPQDGQVVPEEAPTYENVPLEPEEAAAAAQEPLADPTEGTEGALAPPPAAEAAAAAGAVPDPFLEGTEAAGATPTPPRTINEVHRMVEPVAATAAAEVAAKVSDEVAQKVRERQVREEAAAIAQEMRAKGASRAEINDVFRAKLNEAGIKSKRQLAMEQKVDATTEQLLNGNTESAPAGPDIETQMQESLKRLGKRVKAELGNEQGSIRLRGTIESSLKKNSETWNDLKAVGAGVLHYGAREFEAWSKAMIDMVGPDVVPHLQELYPLAQKQLEKFNEKHYERDLPSLDALKIARKAGEPGFEWYDKAPGELKRAFGVNADTFAGAYAATSPLQDAATTNMDLAFKSYNDIISGKRDGVKRRFTPRRDGMMPIVADNLNRVAQGQRVSGPKINPFEGQLRQDAFTSGARDIPVLDTWMFRLFGFMPEDPSTPITMKVGDSQRRFMETVITKMAGDEGVDVNQIQAALWTDVKASVERRRLMERVLDKQGNFNAGWDAERASTELEKINTAMGTPFDRLLMNRLGPKIAALREGDTAMNGDALVGRKIGRAVLRNAADPESGIKVELQKLGMESDVAGDVATQVVDTMRAAGMDDGAGGIDFTQPVEVQPFDRVAANRALAEKVRKLCP